jgi:hypothetical protein
MRRVSLVLAVCGCNQVYGLEPTKSRDAAGPDDRAFRIALLASATTEMSTEAPPVLMPLADPAVEYALLDEPLRAATYVPDDTGGTINYPFAFVGKRWRMVYTPLSGVVHELQWDPLAGAGEIIVPVLGRLERTAPPADTGFILSMKKAGGVLHSFSGRTVIYTTGYWSATPSPFNVTTPTVDFSKSTPFDGAVGAPSDTAHDLVVAIDYGVDANTNCVHAVASGTAVVPTLSAGVMKPLDLVVHAGTIDPTLKLDGEQIEHIGVRLDEVVPRGDPSKSRLHFGKLASTQIPAFMTERDGVPAPYIIPIFNCPIIYSQLSGTNEVGIGFAPAFVGAIVSDRMVGALRLRSSVAFIAPVVGASFFGTSQVPLAKDIRIDAMPLTTDDTPIGDARDLSFAFDRPAPFVADYYEATLYAISNATLVPVRIYTGTDVAAARPTLHVDPSLLADGTSYVFAIRTYRGRPNARTGDFRMVPGSPQAVGTIFTATFRR